MALANHEPPVAQPDSPDEHPIMRLSREDNLEIARLASHCDDSIDNLKQQGSDHDGHQQQLNKQPQPQQQVTSDQCSSSASSPQTLSPQAAAKAPCTEPFNHESFIDTHTKLAPNRETEREPKSDATTDSLQDPRASEPGVARDQSSTPIARAHQIRLLVRRREAGALIGKRGANIRRLRDTFKASTFSIPDTGNGPERVVCIVTASSQSKEAILHDITRMLMDKSPESDDQIELKLLIHSSHAGSIIGIGGQSIKKLRNDSKAAIKIYEMCCPLSNERVCAIKAKPQVVVSTLKLIEQILNENPIKGTTKPYDALHFDLSLVDKYGGYLPDEPLPPDTPLPMGVHMSFAHRLPHHLHGHHHAFYHEHHAHPSHHYYHHYPNLAPQHHHQHQYRTRPDAIFPKTQAHQPHHQQQQPNSCNAWRHSEHQAPPLSAPDQSGSEAPNPASPADSHGSAASPAKSPPSQHLAKTASSRPPQRYHPYATQLVNFGAPHGRHAMHQSGRPLAMDCGQGELSASTGCLCMLMPIVADELVTHHRHPNNMIPDLQQGQHPVQSVVVAPKSCQHQPQQPQTQQAHQNQLKHTAGNSYASYWRRQS